MKRAEAVNVVEEKSGPNIVKLSNGSYIQWDRQDGYFRIAYYERRTQKTSDLLFGISLAMKKPVHNSQVKEIFEYISRTDEYAAATT